jgi:hypothetical protein
VEEENIPLSFESEQRLRTIKRWVKELDEEGIDKSHAAQICLAAHNDLWQKPLQIFPGMIPAQQSDPNLQKVDVDQIFLGSCLREKMVERSELVWDGNSEARPPAPPGYVEAEQWVEKSDFEELYKQKVITAEEIEQTMKWPDHPGSIIPQRGAQKGEEPPEVV